MISDREIERIVSRQSEMGSQERVDYLVQRARDNGGLDNITVEIVEFSITPGSPSKPQRRKIGMIILTVILLICIGASGGYYFGISILSRNLLLYINPLCEGIQLLCCLKLSSRKVKIF